jgi:hypothetical protein
MTNPKSRFRTFHFIFSKALKAHSPESAQQLQVLGRESQETEAGLFQKKNAGFKIHGEDGMVVRGGGGCIEMDG